MCGLGMGELLIILAIVVLLFGASRLPQLGKALGETVRNFKKGTNEAARKPETKEENAIGAHDVGQLAQGEPEKEETKKDEVDKTGNAT